VAEAASCHREVRTVVDCSARPPVPLEAAASVAYREYRSRWLLRVRAARPGPEAETLRTSAPSLTRRLLGIHCS